MTQRSNGSRRTVRYSRIGGKVASVAALLVVALCLLLSAASVPAAAQDSEPPVADAGSDRTVYAGNTVVFDASGSSDNTGIVNYTWTFYDDGDRVLYGVAPSYRFSSVGVFVVTLNVSDAEGNYDVDTVTITVIPDNVPPTARAGMNRTVPAGTLVGLNASQSSDNVGIVNYTWNFMYGGQNVYLYGPTPRFVFAIPGTYIVTLTVRDAANLTGQSEVVITVTPVPSYWAENWFSITALVAAVIIVSYMVIKKLSLGSGLITRTDIDKLRLHWKNLKRIRREFVRNKMGVIGMTILVVFVGMAFLAEPLYAVGLIQNPNKVIESSDPYKILQPPTWSHLLGTDEKGRDVVSEIVYGSRNSLIVGFAAAVLTMVLGAGVGLIAGAYGRGVDEFLMRLTDVFLVIPWLPFAVILASFLPPLHQPSMYKIIIVIGVTSWPAAARIVRSQVLSIRERAFIERAIAVGSGRGHIMRTHLLPNVFPLVFANAILSVSYAILSEAFLAFFGISDVTKITWGSMLYNAFNFGGFANRAYWYVLPPGLCIIIVVLGFTFVSYALDDIMNPKLRKR